MLADDAPVMSEVAGMRMLLSEQCGAIPKDTQIECFQNIVDCATSAMGEERDIFPWAQERKATRTRSLEEDWHAQADHSWDNFQLRRFFSVLMLHMCTPDAAHSASAGGGAASVFSSVYIRLSPASPPPDGQAKAGSHESAGREQPCSSFFDCHANQKLLAQGRCRSAEQCRAVVAGLCSMCRAHGSADQVNAELVFASMNGALRAIVPQLDDA